MTAHALGDDRNVFNCGISVAPVTDWRYYGKVILCFSKINNVSLCKNTITWFDSNNNICL